MMDENLKLLLITIIIVVGMTMACNYCKKEKNKK
jgi:hypothetical protein